MIKRRNVLFFFFLMWRVCFNEKCVVKQLTMETSFMFRVSTRQGEQAGRCGCLGSQRCPRRRPGAGCGASCRGSRDPAQILPSARAVCWPRPAAQSVDTPLCVAGAAGPLVGRWRVPERWHPYPGVLRSHRELQQPLCSARVRSACFNPRNSSTFLDIHFDVVCGLNITYDRCSSHCFQLNLAC